MKAVLFELGRAPVGDTVEYGYYGARKAGLKAFLIDREDKIGGDIEKIHDLREILTVV